MKTKYSYDTVIEALNDLLERGYSNDFSILADDECLICNQTSQQLSPEEFEIDEIYRFEGMTDPGDEMILYAISSKNQKIKGTVLNAYGMYSNSDTSKIVKRLKTSLNFNS
jgi:hypothetical protein